MDNQDFLEIQCSAMLDGIESLAPASSKPMARKISSAKPHIAKSREEVPGQSDRLKRLRKSLGYDTSTAFAVFLEISVQRYNSFENGAPLSREIAFRLVQRIPGLTLDWLYFGKPHGLPLELAQRLGIFDPPGKRTIE